MPPELPEIRKRIAEELPRLRIQYGIESLAVFGSYLHGNQRPDSDLDLLVAFARQPSLFRFVRLENELSDLTGIHVDLVHREALRPSIGKRILDEAIPL